MHRSLELIRDPLIVVGTVFFPGLFLSTDEAPVAIEQVADSTPVAKSEPTLVAEVGFSVTHYDSSHTRGLVAAGKSFIVMCTLADDTFKGLDVDGGRLWEADIRESMEIPPQVSSC